MGKVVEIGITDTKGSRINKVNEVEAFNGKGLLNDRKFKENNHKKSQITLIEIENINYFNSISETNIRRCLIISSHFFARSDRSDCGSSFKGFLGLTSHQT